MYLRLRGKVKLGAPEKSHIAILDECSHEWLLDLLEGRAFAIVGNPGNVFYVNAHIFKSFTKWFFKTDHPSIAYSIALIEVIEPKVVLTIIDNSSLFYEVSRHCKHIRFIAIQNANRLDIPFLTPDEARKIHIPEFACFGEYERDLYTSVKASVKNFYPIGSLRDAMYREKYPIHPQKEYDVCVVSEPTLNGDTVWFPGVEMSVVMILDYAIRFCEKHKLKLCVAGKRFGPHFENEKKWYEAHLGREIDFVAPIRFEYSTPRLIDQSAVSLAQVSTALREGMGRGNRVLFCNYSENKNFDFPVDGLWFLKDPSFAAFEQRMLTLLQMSDSEFQEVAGDTAKYIVNYDSSAPTNKFLTKLIRDAVSSQM